MDSPFRHLGPQKYFTERLVHMCDSYVGREGLDYSARTTAWLCTGMV